ncbi:hypothetical protein EC957_010565 [Mortierella hygrophila]|uniref:Uncharacterized protein n=1 Tax=Mortierella hygrophila TaxID=979708 RepID=A0A9P6F9P2_9FUNG|nr:hypothetical protein EC957_010565 [Mortierella hygrophila]
MMWDSGRYDWTRLSACIRTNNITLDSSHFSMHRVDMTLEEKEYFLTEVHSRSTRELALWALDVTPQLLQTFFLPPAHLTSLELYWKPTTIMRSSVLAYSNLQELAHASRLVHQYLCGSDYLVHLTTLKTAIQHEDLDLFSRAAYVDLDKGFDNRTLQETTFQHLSSAPVLLPLLRRLLLLLWFGAAVASAPCTSRSYVPKSSYSDTRSKIELSTATSPECARFSRIWKSVSRRMIDPMRRDVWT